MLRSPSAPVVPKIPSRFIAWPVFLAIRPHTLLFGASALAHPPSHPSSLPPPISPPPPTSTTPPPHTAISVFSPQEKACTYAHGTLDLPARPAIHSSPRKEQTNAHASTSSMKQKELVFLSSKKTPLESTAGKGEGEGLCPPSLPSPSTHTHYPHASAPLFIVRCSSHWALCFFCPVRWIRGFPYVA